MNTTFAFIIVFWLLAPIVYCERWTIIMSMHTTNMSF